MGVINGAATGSNANRINVWIEWWESTIDYANNRSYVSARFYAQTKPDQTSTTYDNNGSSNFYVNGNRVSGIVNGSINFRSASPHNRPLNVLGTWEGWVGRDGNGNVNISFSGDFSLSSSYISGGSAGGTVGLTTIWTAAGAPSSPRFDQNPYENALTFRWNAGSGGVNNGITGYHIYYRINGGAEQLIAVGVTTAHSIDTSNWGRGTQVDFHVYAITQRGDNPGSAWSAKATKNRTPYQPTSPSVPMTSYIPGETIRVSYANTGDPDGNLAGFEVATDQDETIIGTTASASAAYVDLDTTGWPQGIQRKFRVRGYDALGVRGPWSLYTALVTLNTAPVEPEVSYPAAGSTVYNRRPRILLKAAATNDGPKHILCVTAAGSETTTAAGTGFSCGINDDLASGQQVVYQPQSDLTIGGNNISSRMYDSFLYSPTVTRAFTVSAFAPVDPDLTVSGRLIRAVHITDLQVAAGNLRAAYGLAAVNWMPCVAGATPVSTAAVLIEQIQIALQSVIDRINGWDAGTTTGDISVAWISPAAAGGGVDRVKLRQAIEQLRSTIIII